MFLMIVIAYSILARLATHWTYIPRLKMFLVLKATVVSQKFSQHWTLIFLPKCTKFPTNKIQLPRIF